MHAILFKAMLNHTWFLGIAFVHKVGMCVHTRMSAPAAINNYSC